MLTKTITDLFMLEASRLVNALLDHECKCFIEEHRSLKTAEGLSMVVRCGYNTERLLDTHIGKILIKLPKTRTRNQEKQIYRSQFIKPYKRSVTSQATRDSMILFIHSIKDVNTQGAIEAVFGHDACKGQIAHNIINGFNYLDVQKQLQNRIIGNQSFLMAWCEGVAPNKNIGSGGLLIICGVLLSGQHQIIEISDGNPNLMENWMRILVKLKYLGVNFPVAIHGNTTESAASALAEVYPDTTVNAV